MPFLGVQPTDTFASVAKQTITGDGSVTYTLTHSVAGANDLAVFVNNVRQEPTVAYSTSGTSITFTEAIDSTDDCYVVYIARTFQTVTAPDNSVNADQLSYPLTDFSSTGIDDNATSTQITLTNNRVGIGESNPQAKLDVSSGATASQATYNGQIKTGVYSTNGNLDSGVEWQVRGDGAGYGFRAINIHAGGGNQWRLQSRENSASWTDRITVDQGKVGIGTTDPSGAGLVIDAKGSPNTSASLHLKSNVDTYLRVARFGTASDSTLTIGNNYNRDSGSFAADNSSYAVHSLTFHTDGSMRFGTGAAGSTAPTQRMRITSSGNVGINETAPNAKLQINGGSADYTSSATGTGLFHVSAGATSEYSFYVGVADQGVQLGHNGGGSRFLSFETNETERMRLDASGNLLVGTTSASRTGKQQIFATSSNSYTSLACESSTPSTIRQIRFYNPNGEIGFISSGGTSTAYSTSSDYRLKENVVDLDNGIDRLKQIPVHRFNFIADPDTTVDGFIAHEVQDVVPEAITGEKDAVDDEGNPEYQGIDQSKLVPLLTAALQEAVTRIETLEAEVAALKGA